MTNDASRNSIPEFVFICGAVGSGNSFMFGSLTFDENVYGINEDALGVILGNFLRPENARTCPHAIDEFVGFMSRLRRDRRTLLLKTPSNVRHLEQIREYLPRSRFILMIRDPHGAIVSGISRHGAKYTVEDIARIWLSDCQQIEHSPSDSVVITFRQLVSDPRATLTRVSETVMPVSDEAFAYACRVNRPERAGTDWWKSRVTDEQRIEVEHWVEQLGLLDVYDATRNDRGPGGEGTGDEDVTKPSERSAIFQPLVNARRQFYRVWYRLTR